VRLLPTKLGAGSVAAALVVSAVPAHASSPPCVESNAMEAARIHDLRIMLMVNALKCRIASPQTLRAYRTFDAQRGDDLAVYGDKVEASMINQFGPHHGRVAFDRYETSLSNYHSGFTVTRDSCAETAAHIKLATRANDAELATLSKLATNRSIDSCLVPTSDRSFAAAPAMSRRDTPSFASQPAPMPRPMAQMSQPRPAPAPEMVDGVPTYPAPGLAPVVQREPGLTVIELPPPGPGNEDKLAEAISALDAAAAALRDMQDTNQ